MKHIQCEQLSPEWFEARRGIATASKFDKIIMPKKMELSASAKELAYELIADKYRIGPPEEEFVSKAMQHGTDTEPEARRWYCLEKNVDTEPVGLLLTDDGRFGASPDSLIGDDGLLELKCPMLKTHVKYLVNGGLPDEYRAQCHGQLIVAEREWCDFVSYAPGLPPLVVRVVPDAFTRALRVCLEAFWMEYQECLAKIEALQPQEATV